MHKYMRAIGFSKLSDRREEQRLITDIIMNATYRSYTSNGEDTILAEFCEGVDQHLSGFQNTLALFFFFLMQFGH